MPGLTVPPSDARAVAGRRKRLTRGVVALSRAECGRTALGRGVVALSRAECGRTALARGPGVLAEARCDSGGRGTGAAALPGAADRGVSAAPPHGPTRACCVRCLRSSRLRSDMSCSRAARTLSAVSTGPL